MVLLRGSSPNDDRLKQLARRRLQFSLRTILLVTSALALWLGWLVHRAQVQREAVRQIEAAGGTVQYDWQPGLTRLAASARMGLGGNVVSSSGGRGDPPGRLAEWIGREHFQQVRAVVLRPHQARLRVKPRSGRARRWPQTAELELAPGAAVRIDRSPDEFLRSLVPHLQRLSQLETVFLEKFPASGPCFSEQACAELRSALPGRQVLWVFPAVEIDLPLSPNGGEPPAAGRSGD